MIQHRYIFIEKRKPLASVVRNWILCKNFHQYYLWNEVNPCIQYIRCQEPPQRIRLVCGNINDKICRARNKIGSDQVEKNGSWTISMCSLVLDYYECSEYHAIDTYVTTLRGQRMNQMLLSDDIYHRKRSGAWNWWSRRGYIGLEYLGSFLVNVCDVVWVILVGFTGKLERILVYNYCSQGVFIRKLREYSTQYPRFRMPWVRSGFLYQAGTRVGRTVSRLDAWETSNVSFFPLSREVY